MNRIMKSGLLMLTVWLTISVSTGQTVGAINTGISDLDADLNEVDALANKDIQAFTNMIATDYNTTVSAVNNIISAGLKPAEALLAFEVGSIMNIPVNKVVDTYKSNKSKGWGFVAMQLGIKPGSPEFHQLKGKCKSDKDKFKKLKPNKENSNGTIQPSNNDKVESDKVSSNKSDNVKSDDSVKGNSSKGNNGNGGGNSKGKGKGK